MLRLDKAAYLWLFFKFIWSERLSNSLWGLDVLLFPEFVNIVSILFYSSIEFIVFLYTFLVISFTQCKKYMIWISFSTILDVLSAFTCASAIGDIWSIPLGVSNLSLLLDISIFDEFEFSGSATLLTDLVMEIFYSQNHNKSFPFL